MGHIMDCKLKRTTLIQKHFVFWLLLLCFFAGTSIRCVKAAENTDETTKIRLSLADESQYPNALFRGQTYPFQYVFEGAEDAEVTKYKVYYEVMVSNGKPSKYATITQDGVFKSSACAEFCVSVYAFAGNYQKNKWLQDRSKYAKYLLCSDTMKVTVSAKGFRTTPYTMNGYHMELAESYSIEMDSDNQGAYSASIHALASDKKTAASNIQMVLKKVPKDDADIERLGTTIKDTYTRKSLADSMKKMYQAQKASVTKYSVKFVKLSGKRVVRLKFYVTLTNIHVKMEEAADVKIDRLEFCQTMYSWFDGRMQWTISVTDAMESIQPNISHAAEKLVESIIPEKAYSK